MSLSRLLPVLQADVDREVFRWTPEQAARYVARNQARWIRGHRALRLSHHYQMPADGGRTRTSRGGLLAAIGRSQCYTIDDSRGRVSGFKHIDAVDLHVFRSATIEATVGGSA